MYRPRTNHIHVIKSQIHLVRQSLKREKRGFPFRPRPHLCCGLSAAGRRKPANNERRLPADDMEEKDDMARTVDDIELITIGEVLEQPVNT
jgi:hypothetical protein